MKKAEQQLISEARERALEVLFGCVTPAGFRASALAEGYPQVWGRDSMVTFLGTVASGEPELIKTGRASLETLGQYQSPMGLIPLNVNPNSGYISTENAGAVDSNLWFILGHYIYNRQSGDDDFLARNWEIIQKALLWLDYQDSNGCGLLEIPEAGNWMDLLAVRYNTLYDNVLYYAASLAYQEMSKKMPSKIVRPTCQVDAACIHERINLLFWIDRCWVAAHFAEHLEKLKVIRLEWFMLYEPFQANHFEFF